MYEYWFARINGISAKKKRKLREYYGSGKAIYYIEETKSPFPDFLTEKEQQILRDAQKEMNLEEQFLNMQKENIQMILYDSIHYPKRLKAIVSPPYALYVKGKLPDEEKMAVSIVGARRCSGYGEFCALEYGRELAAQGIEIISGMARGIDGAGQRGALNAGGNTYAVLGCGVDVCYPKEHKGLYNDIQKTGGILSEFAPGTKPFPMNFPARNRIISGLSDIVLVMEAKEKSGSLITADLALEQGKDVYALPGPVTSALSTGCHFLISQGAGILISPSELLKEIGVFYKKLEQNSDKNKKELETAENIVYSFLDLYPKGIQILIEETGLSAKEVMAELTSLEIEGKVKEISKNQYIKC